MKRLIYSMLRAPVGNLERLFALALVSVALELTSATTALAEGPKPVAPAPPPAIQPATTPKEALRQLNAAMRDGDRDRIRALMDARTPVEASMVDAMASMADALAGLQRASVKAFGPDAAKDVTGDDGSRWAEGLARIESADVKQSGDTATVTYRARATPAEPRTGVSATFEGAPKSAPNEPAPPAPTTRPSTAPAAAADRTDHSEPITLRRVNGVWRMPVSQLAPGVDQAALEQRLAELAVQADLVREITAEIDAGKFNTPEQAADAWHSRFMQSLAPKPATRPKQH